MDGEGFSEPGLGGRDVSLSPLNQAPGGNPAIHWNVLLQVRLSGCLVVCIWQCTMGMHAMLRSRIRLHAAGGSCGQLVGMLWVRNGV